MRILITGAAGFIGSAMCNKLLLEGHEIMGMDNLLTGTLFNLPLKHDNFTFRKVDVNNRSEFKKALGSFNPKWIFHYAAVVGVKYTLEHPKEVYKDEKGTNNIFNAINYTDVNTIVVASSSEVYADGHSLKENTSRIEESTTPYIDVKLKNEIMGNFYGKHRHVNVITLRIFNTYGPKQRGTDYGFVIPIFIENCLENEPIIIYGDGTATRDFIYIQDNINYTYDLALRAKEGNIIVNICNGDPISILNLAKKIKKLTNSNSEIIFEDRRNDKYLRGGSSKKLKQLTDLKSRHSLDEGLLKTIEYYKWPGMKK